jgi:hypothetical protein
MITPILAFTAHSVFQQGPRLPLPSGTVIQHLTGSRKGRSTMRCEPPLGPREPTHLRIHITRNERRCDLHALLRLHELECLGHAHRFRDRSPQFITHFIIRLHVCVNEAQRPPGRAVNKFHPEPALRDPGIEPHCGQKGIKSGVAHGPISGAPGHGQPRSEDTCNVGLPRWLDKRPPVGRKGCGPQPMFGPHFLENHDVGTANHPIHDLLNGRRGPWKSFYVIRHQAEPHYGGPWFLVILLYATSGGTLFLFALNRK